MLSTCLLVWDWTWEFGLLLSPHPLNGSFTIHLWFYNVIQQTLKYYWSTWEFIMFYTELKTDDTSLYQWWYHQEIFAISTVAVRHTLSQKSSRKNTCNLIIKPENNRGSYLVIPVFLLKTLQGHVQRATYSLLELVLFVSSQYLKV